MYNFKFPDIGEGIHEGRLLKWFFKVGDSVKEGETLCIVETDKVNAELPSPVNGIVEKLGVSIGEIIHVGETLILIQDDLNAKPTVASEPKKSVETVSEGENAGVVGELEVSSEVIAPAFVEENSTKQTSRVLASPLARMLAKDHQIEIQSVKGTGEFGRVLKTDVERAIETKSTPKVEVPKVSPNDPNSKIRRVPVTQLRKAIVNAMTVSKQIIPHTILMDEIDVTELVNLRNAQKDLAKSEGIHLTYMPFIIKAITKTIKQFPIFNASFDHEKGEIIYKDFMNIGFATDTKEGLVVPNIKDADTLSVYELAKKLKDLQTKAIDRTLQLKDIQNGTFTITNYGAFDALYGTPIIKYPEVAIMGIGKIIQKPVVKNNAIVIAHVMPISFAVDHRIIDGADAGRFVMMFKSLLNNPVFMLLS
ncbi:2-oxo acid dehydrogenase subunit E2 [Acholeplasma vituli]|uniref:Dihydrolipoamide acetyltransferase component of pyruvate dehydrogenase complex n=1 Tax=Paracholeplasma vituli TaxID=69473 RepID=A0ABT2PUH2_9MOLU|nr:dihydrolipoamide acetyltransferase family protein [Paracholeplasma vituli]MCU0104593.1 2-oxo acid dehydrogenase subunit E2 [Paracholeplasma vituli]